MRDWCDGATDRTVARRRGRTSRVQPKIWPGFRELTYSGVDGRIDMQYRWDMTAAVSFDTELPRFLALCWWNSFYCLFENICFDLIQHAYMCVCIFVSNTELGA